MKEITSLNIIESNGNLHDGYKEKLFQDNRVFTKKLYNKLKKIASSPGQVLDHQEVRHPPKDHSHRKDQREKRTRSRTTFRLRHPDAAILFSVQKRARFVLCAKHMYAYTLHCGTVRRRRRRSGQNAALPRSGDLLCARFNYVHHARDFMRGDKRGRR